MTLGRAYQAPRGRAPRSAGGRCRTPLEQLGEPDVRHAPDEVIGGRVGVGGGGVVDDRWRGVEQVVDADLQGGPAGPRPDLVAAEQVELEIATHVAPRHGEVVA